MKRNEFLRLATMASLASGTFLLGCKEDDKNKTAGKNVTYTCSMHPQVVQNKPGTCPICAMDLVLVDKSNTGATIMLGASQMALANISVMSVGKGLLNNSKRLNGRLAINPEHSIIVASRTTGRIEKLYFQETGVKIAQNQPIYKIYSEQLSALQQEYILAHEQVRNFPLDNRFAAIEKAAIQKLKLYDQSDAEIKSLSQSEKQDPYIMYRAPISGTVSEVSVSEGQYVAEGSPVLRIESYASLWVEADIYPDEATLVQKGQKVLVEVPGWEGESIPMKIDFITPVMQTGGQLIRIRGAIVNPNQQWQPGLQANIILPTSSNKDAITLPVDAVIRDENGTHVWIETTPRTFLARNITIGAENASEVEVIEGLTMEDKVVVTGAYLLYSEYVLKKGSIPMANHKH